MDDSGIVDAAPWIAGAPVAASDWFVLENPYDGTPVARVARSSASTVDAAVSAAHATHTTVADLPAHTRAAILRRAADLVEERPHDLAARVTRQTGKAIKNTMREVSRSALTFRAAATAAEGLAGTVYAPDVSPEGTGLLTLGIRQPVGVIAAITPFNAPFNLVAHKVAPAFAAGNAIVVKPADQAPLSAIDVARLMESAGAPAGAVNVVPGGVETGKCLVADDRVRMLTFTGGRAGGEAVRVAAGLRKVTLELGGNSPNIVHRDAPVGPAALACLNGGFSNTGQSCNSVQRIIVHRDVVDPFVSTLRDLMASLVVGDPMDARTDVGTLVDEAAAKRVEEWLEEARRAGANVIGGARTGSQLQPAVVVGAPADSRVVCEEVFGPVVVIQPYDRLDEAIDLANATSYGLQAAVFTDSLEVAMRIAREVDSGAVLVNRSSNFRMDHLPYGGVKQSGIGREGPAFAVEDMTELKLLVFAPPNRES